MAQSVLVLALQSRLISNSPSSCLLRTGNIFLHPYTLLGKWLSVFSQRDQLSDLPLPQTAVWIWLQPKIFAPVLSHLKTPVAGVEHWTCSFRRELGSAAWTTAMHGITPQLWKMGPLRTPGCHRLVMEGGLLCQLHRTLSHTLAASRADLVRTIP